MARKKKSQNIIDGWRMHDALCHAGLSAMEWDPWIRHSYMDEFCQKSFQKKRNSARTDHSVEYDYIAYRFRGFPDAKQEHQLRCTAGCTRFLWNRMLADYLDLYRIMGVTVKNTPVDYKSLDELSFLNDVDSFALANVQLQLESAISDWQSGEKGKPRFKKKTSTRILIPQTCRTITSKWRTAPWCFQKSRERSKCVHTARLLPAGS